MARWFRAVFIVACRDAADLFELGEAAFDQVTLGMKGLVEWIPVGSRRVVRDDGLGRRRCRP